MVKYQGCRQEENFWIILKFWKNLLIKRAKNLLLSNSDGSRSKFVDPGRVGSAIYGLGLDLENFPLKMSNFSIFTLRVKKNLFRAGQKVPGSMAGQPLIYCGSKVCSGRVGSRPISTFKPWFLKEILAQSI